MGKTEKPKVFSEGDRVCYKDGNIIRVGTIIDRQTVYSWGTYRYQIIFDGQRESDRLWYEGTDLTEYKEDQDLSKKTGSHPIYCRKCGTQLVEGVRFCRICGTEVISEEKKKEQPQSDQRPEILSDKELNSLLARITTLRRYEVFLNEIKGDFASPDDLMCDTRARLMMDKEGISYNAAVAKAKKEFRSAYVDIDNNDAFVKTVYKAVTGKEMEPVPTTTSSTDKPLRQPSNLSEIETYDDFMKRYSK